MVTSLPGVADKEVKKKDSEGNISTIAISAITVGWTLSDSGGGQREVAVVGKFPEEDTTCSWGLHLPFLHEVQHHRLCRNTVFCSC